MIYPVDFRGQSAKGLLWARPGLQRNLPGYRRDGMPERMFIDQVQGIAVHPWLEKRLTRIISFTAVSTPVIAYIIASVCIFDGQHLCACQWRGRPGGDEPARRAEFLDAASGMITPRSPPQGASHFPNLESHNSKVRICSWGGVVTSTPSSTDRTVWRKRTVSGV